MCKVTTIIVITVHKSLKIFHLQTNINKKSRKINASVTKRGCIKILMHPLFVP